VSGEYLSSEEARRRAAAAAKVLASDPRVRLVFLFGSARGAGSRVGDIDLAILTEPRLELDSLMKLRAEVVDTVGGAIDLVSLNQASVVLAFEVADSGECLFSREPEDEVDFVLRARMGYWDWKPFLDEQWRLAGQRLEERRLGTES
jgi:predicted nucleotidyltransferase